MALDIGSVNTKDLVDRTRGLVSRDIFVDSELYEIEKERVFARCWLFVGFEDQVRKPGDYFVSRMGEESVILSRDRNNTIHVFLNSCRHRGMKVCRYDEGNTPVFTCPYHGWSYAGDGSLVGVPRYKDAYREELDKSQWGLVEVAQLANFHGTIWATWDPKAPPFLEYIGDNEPGLALFFDRPDGSEADLEVFGGIMKWIMPCNWKFGAENFLGDSYHAQPTHRSVDLVGITPSGGQGRHLNSTFRERARGGGKTVGFTVSHHGSGRLGFSFALEDLPYIPGYQNTPVVEDYFREAHERRKHVLGKHSRIRTFNGNIFPNATQGTHNSIAVWQPNGPDSTEVWRWYWVQRDAPREVRDLLRHYYMTYGGPGGLTESDDMENWGYAHKSSKGTIARRHPYNYAMGVSREQREHPLFREFGLPLRGVVTESGRGGPAPNEQNQRGAYNFWLEMMDSKSWDDLREKGLWH